MSRGSSRRSSPTTSPPPRVRVPWHVARLITRLVVDSFDYAARPGASACRAAHYAACRRLLCLAQARRRPLRLAQARRRLPRLHRASGCLGTSRDSSSTTSTTPHVRLLRHVARLVAPLDVDYFASRRLVVDYFASRRLVIDYFAYAARPGASARRAARHAARHTARCRLLRLAQARRRLLRLRRAARHAARRAARRRLLRLAQARRRLLRLRRATGCLGTSRGSSCGSLRRSSSTTSPTPRDRVPRHVARLVAWLVVSPVVDYFAYAARSGASARRATSRVAHCVARRQLLRLHRASRHVARPVTRLIVDYSVHRDFVLRPRWLYFSHTMRGDYLSRGNTGSTSSTPRAATTSSSGRIASTIHL
jgi:hypothetical protein